MCVCVCVCVCVLLLNKSYTELFNRQLCFTLTCNPAHDKFLEAVSSFSLSCDTLPYSLARCLQLLCPSVCVCMCIWFGDVVLARASVRKCEFKMLSEFA